MIKPTVYSTPDVSEDDEDYTVNDETIKDLMKKVSQLRKINKHQGTAVAECVGITTQVQKQCEEFRRTFKQDQQIVR